MVARQRWQMSGRYHIVHDAHGIRQIDCIDRGDLLCGCLLTPGPEHEDMDEVLLDRRQLNPENAIEVAKHVSVHPILLTGDLPDIADTGPVSRENRNDCPHRAN